MYCCIAKEVGGGQQIIEKEGKEKKLSDGKNYSRE